MCKSDDETSDQRNTTNIEQAFKDRESNEFYKYYYHNEATKEVISTWGQLREFYYRTFPKHEASKWLFRGDVFAYKNEDDSERSMGKALHRGGLRVLTLCLQVESCRAERSGVETSGYIQNVPPLGRQISPFRSAAG